MVQGRCRGGEDVEDRSARKGATFSLSQVKGKSVVGPDFERLVKREKRRAEGRNQEREGKVGEGEEARDRKAEGWSWRSPVNI